MTLALLARIEIVEQTLLAQLQEDTGDASLGREEVLQWLKASLSKELPSTVDAARKLAALHFQDAKKEFNSTNRLPTDASFKMKLRIALKSLEEDAAGEGSRTHHFKEFTFEPDELMEVFRRRVHWDSCENAPGFGSVKWWHADHDDYECLPFLWDAIYKTCGYIVREDASHLLQLRALQRKGRLVERAVEVILQMLHGPRVCQDCLCTKWRNSLSGNAFFRHKCRNTRASCPSYWALSGRKMQAVDADCREVRAVLIGPGEEGASPEEAYAVTHTLTGSELFRVPAKTRPTDVRFLAARVLKLPIACVRMHVPKDFPLADDDSRFACQSLESGTNTFGVHVEADERRSDLQLWESFLSNLPGVLPESWTSNLRRLLWRFFKPLLGYHEYKIVGSVATQTCLRDAHNCDVVLQWYSEVPENVFERIEACCETLGLYVQPSPTADDRKAVTVFFQGTSVDLIPGSQQDGSTLAAWALARLRYFRLLQAAGRESIEGTPVLPMEIVRPVILLVKLLRADWLRHSVEQGDDTSPGTLGLGSCHIENITLYCAWRYWGGSDSEDSDEEPWDYYADGVPALLTDVLRTLSDIDLTKKAVLQHPGDPSLKPSPDELAQTKGPLYMCAPWSPEQNLLEAEPMVWKFAKECAGRTLMTLGNDPTFTHFIRAFASRGMSTAMQTFLDNHNRYPFLLENPWEVGPNAVCWATVPGAAEEYYGSVENARYEAVEQVRAGLANPLLPGKKSWFTEILENFKPQNLCREHAEDFARGYTHVLRWHMDIRV